MVNKKNGRIQIQIITVALDQRIPARVLYIKALVNFLDTREEKIAF